MAFKLKISPFVITKDETPLFVFATVLNSYFISCLISIGHSHGPLKQFKPRGRQKRGLEKGFAVFSLFSQNPQDFLQKLKKISKKWENLATVPPGVPCPTLLLSFNYNDSNGRFFWVDCFLNRFQMNRKEFKDCL